MSIPKKYNICSSTSGNGIFNNGRIYNYNAPDPGMIVDGDIKCQGSIFLKDKDLGKLLEQIESRLAILVPDPKKLEKFEALRKAYEQYKTI
jgi:hypothetical protein